MIDPFNALNIATAVVQFVDYASRLVVEGYGTYKSSEGTSKEYVEIQTLCDDLEQLCVRLSATPTTALAPSSSEAALYQLALQCQTQAKELSELLESFKVRSNGPLRGWESIRQAFRKISKKERITMMQAQLDTIRSQVNTHLMNVVRNYQSTTMESLGKLTTKSEEMQVQTIAELRESKNELLEAIARQERELTELKRRQSLGCSEQLATVQSCGESMLDLSQKLNTLLREGRNNATTLCILDSLRFPEMPMRHAEIRDAYEQTFGWIFEDNTTPFMSWLASHPGVFWINGRAGSGKSTLMKFLAGHSQTMSTLEDWAKTDNQQLIAASFYFWNSGYAMQRTQEGLLQSLLFQILRARPWLVPTIFPRRWAQDEFFHLHPDPWTRRELSEALSAILSKDTAQLSAKFCFFIDGLDEYEGDYHDLIQDLQHLAESNSVKLCVSSRPWIEFRDAFGGNKDRSLVLENLTRDDMSHFIQGMLAKDERFVRFANREPHAMRLVSDIMDRAQGVFLWVFLVVRSLLRGIDKHDDISILQKRLDDLPSDLEEFFRHMLDSIEPVYQDYTARLLQLAVRAPGSLPLMVVSYLPLEMNDPDFALKSPIIPLSDAKAEELRIQATYRINAWTRDLLEVYRPPLGWDLAKGFVLQEEVHFLHRTVKEFLVTKEMQSFLDSRIRSDFNPWLTLVRANLVRAKSIPIYPGGHKNFWQFINVAEEMALSAKEHERNVDSSPVQLIDELNRVGKHLWLIGGNPELHWTCSIGYAEHMTRCSPQRAFTAFAVEEGLALYVRTAIDRTPEFTDIEYRSLLLCHALDPIHAATSVSESRLEMVQLLLKSGANPNTRLEQTYGTNKSTPWQVLLDRCSTERDPEIWPIVIEMINAGADIFPESIFAPSMGFSDYTVRECLWRSCPMNQRAHFESIIEQAQNRQSSSQSSLPSR